MGNYLGYGTTNEANELNTTSTTAGETTTNKENISTNANEITTNKETSNYPYKRTDHYNSWISMYCKNLDEIILDDDYDLMVSTVNNHCDNIADLTLIKFKNIIYNYCLTLHRRYYDCLTRIFYRLKNSDNYPIDFETTEKFKHMFGQIQQPFYKYCPSDRAHFLSCCYATRKFCEILKIDNIDILFPYPYSQSKLDENDKIWKGICEELGWEFIQSRSRK